MSSFLYSMRAKWIHLYGIYMIEFCINCWLLWYFMDQFRLHEGHRVLRFARSSSTKLLFHHMTLKSPKCQMGSSIYHLYHLWRSLLSMPFCFLKFFLFYDLILLSYLKAFFIVYVATKLLKADDFTSDSECYVWLIDCQCVPPQCVCLFPLNWNHV